MQLRRSVPAGLADAGLASLATFAIGFAAIRLLNPAEIGVYAIFFSAFVAGTMIPAQLVYIPAEVASLEMPAGARPLMSRRTLGIGLAVGVPALLATVAAYLLAPADDVPNVLLPLAITSGCATIVSPAQDHLRRLLHLAGRPYAAVTVSAVQLATTLAALVALNLVAEPAWTVFGALTIANVVSTSAAFLLGRRRASEPLSEIPRIRFVELSRSGRWLLLTEFAPKGSVLLVSTMVAILASPEALGYAESARVAASPLMVVAIGLNAAVRPRSLTAANNGDLNDARKTERSYILVMAAGALGYLAVAGASFPWNPLAKLLPVAYEISGLVAVSAAANLVFGATLPIRNEFIGSRRERELAGIDVFTSLIPLALALSAPVMGAFTRPVALATRDVAKIAIFRRAAKRIYRRLTVREPHDLGARPVGATPLGVSRRPSRGE